MSGGDTKTEESKNERMNERKNRKQQPAGSPTISDYVVEHGACAAIIHVTEGSNPVSRTHAR